VKFNNRNILVVAISVGIAMIPVVRDDFYNAFPDWFQTIFHSGISAGAIVAILLNQLLNSDKQRAKIEAEEQSGISAHDAVRENPQVEPKGEAAQIPR
jgi:NCS2 family nucleobase:cation symporter-2